MTYTPSEEGRYPAAAAAAASPITAKTPRRTRSRAGCVVAIVFAVIYAFAIFEALSNLIGITQFFAQIDVALPTNAFLTVIGQIAAPVVVFVLVLFGTRRTRTWASALAFLVGFFVVSVVTLDLQSLYRTIVPF